MVPIAAQRTGNNGNATFMGLPPELRVRVYDVLIATQDLFIRPIPLSKSTRTGLCRNVWALPLVCRLVRKEVLPKLPSTRDLTFQIMQFSRPALEKWLEQMGQQRISQIRLLDMDGEGECMEYPHECTVHVLGSPWYVVNCQRCMHLAWYTNGRTPAVVRTMQLRRGLLTRLSAVSARSASAWLLKKISSSVLEARARKVMGHDPGWLLGLVLGLVLWFWTGVRHISARMSMSLLNGAAVRRGSR